MGIIYVSQLKVVLSYIDWQARF